MIALNQSIHWYGELMIRRHIFALFLLALQSVSLATTTTNILVPFQANYKVSTKGINIGTAQKMLSQISPHHFRYALDVTPSKLVQLFRDQQDQLQLYSIFSVEDDGTLHPIKYQISDKLGTKMLTFEHGGLQACKNNKPTQCESAKPATKLYDLATVELAYMKYLSQHPQDKHSKTYAVIGDSLNATTLSSDNTIETITVNDKAYHAIKVLMTEKSMATGEAKNRHTFLWLSPDLHYAPVKIERHQQKNRVITLTLSDYHTHSTKK